MTGDAAGFRLYGLGASYFQAFGCGIAVVRQHQAQRPRSRTPKRDEAGA